MPYYDHTTIRSSITHSGSSVSVTCEVGYRYPDGAKTKDLTCTGTGDWHPDHIPACLSKLSYLNHQITLGLRKVIPEKINVERIF